MAPDVRDVSQDKWFFHMLFMSMECVVFVRYYLAFVIERFCIIIQGSISK